MCSTFNSTVLTPTISDSYTTVKSRGQNVFAFKSELLSTNSSNRSEFWQSDVCRK